MNFLSIVIAYAVCRLLVDPAERIQPGVAGRRRILEHYSLVRILPVQIECYRAAIAARLAHATKASLASHGHP